MNQIDKAYATGMAEVFSGSGMNKTAACKTAEAITELVKKASMFNFSDYPSSSGGMSLSSILIPLLAASAAGYIGYNAGLTGTKGQSSYTNVKNYIGRTLNKFVRKDKSPLMYHFI